MRGGGGVDREMKVVQGVKNEGARNEKAFMQCKKGSAEGKVGKISRKIVGSRTQNEARREKMGFTGQKTSAISRKIARNRVRNGEKREKRRFRSEKDGVGERRKNGLYCRFCNAMK